MMLRMWLALSREVRRHCSLSEGVKASISVTSSGQMMLSGKRHVVKELGRRAWRISTRANHDQGKGCYTRQTSPLVDEWFGCGIADLPVLR